MISEKLSTFSFFKDSKLIEEINQFCSIDTLNSGTALLKKGEYPKYVPIILNGLIKVNRIDEEGNEIFLYYLTKGESCAMTLACCTNYKASKLSATVEEDAEILKIPIAKMDEWISKYPVWRDFVFTSLSSRISSLLVNIDELAFNKLDERLLALLEKIKSAKKADKIEITHSKIASELNTSREVISRILKNLEKEGLLKLSRNSIELL